jgi:hypothetical protein
LLVAVPAVIGILLRVRDARRGETSQDEPKMADPPPSNFLSGSWGRNGSSVRGESSRSDWMLVGALAIAVLIFTLATQL